MRIVINIILILVVFGLGYFLYSNIEEPIKFNSFYQKRTDQVIKKLEKIREAQDYFKAINNEYAGSFDTLETSLKNDSFPIIKVFESEETAEEGEYKYDTTYVAASDSLKTVQWYSSLDSLKYVPNGNGATFDMKADTLTYQKTLTNVVEVGTKYKTFMGKYGDIKYQKYDKNYDPSKKIKFGNMNKPNTSGNWQ